MSKIVRICSINFEDRRMLDPLMIEDDFVGCALSRIDTAVLNKPDIICFPEAFSFYSVPLKNWNEKAKAFELTLDALKNKSKEHNVHIICPTFSFIDECMYNSAILIDNQGRVAGRYEKMYPTIEETTAGIKPGEEVNVIETSLGKIGIVICFDLNFPGLAEQYCRKGAEIIFFCSMFDGGRLLSVWSINYGFWIVSSVFNGTNKVIDPMGTTRAESSLHQSVIFYDINLDSGRYHIDYNKPKIEEVRMKYGKKVNIFYHSPEGRVFIESNCEKTIHELEEEFELESLDDYLMRSKPCKK